MGYDPLLCPWVDGGCRPRGSRMTQLPSTLRPYVMFVSVLVAGLVLLASTAAVVLARHGASRIVATVPGLAGTGTTYHLEYAPNGDLTFGQAVGGPRITQRVYYGSTSVTRFEWHDPHHVKLTMEDGTVVELWSGARITRP